MKKIGILSDTHGELHPKILNFFSNCDQIWHAGDIGNIEVYDRLSDYKPLKAVYGNIDGNALRASLQEAITFFCEDVKVALCHIGGYPRRYAPGMEKRLQAICPDIFVCGHSHILKVQYDAKNKFLYINPGAAGNSGFHTHITAIRLVIDGKDIREMEVFDMERGKL